MHLTNVLEGCICQYIRLVYWRDVSLNTVNFMEYCLFWISISVLLCSKSISIPPPQSHTQEAKFQPYLNTTLTYFLFVRLFNIEHLCGEILNQSSDASEVQPTCNFGSNATPIPGMK